MVESADDTHPTLGDRLAASRRAAFVGRDGEVADFVDAMRPGSPWAVIFVHGPGGVGKSTLLARLADEAARLGATTTLVNGDDVEATPPAFLEAMGEVHGGDQARHVLFVDAYERLVALDDWLRGTLLPQLPGQVLVVLAGRHPPSHGWRLDPGWRAVTRVVPLRNLAPAEAWEYLSRQGVPDDARAQLAAATYGHPLALSMAADLHTRGLLDRSPSSHLTDAPDFVQTMLRRLLDGDGSADRRDALAVMALAMHTDEALLSDVLGDEAAAAFTWLQSLPFVAAGARGLAPHELVRDLVEADLRWRDRSAFDELHARVFRHFVARARGAAGRTRQQATAEAMYLSRHHPVMAANWDRSALGNAYADRLRPDDVARLVAMARLHEGEASAALARRWIERQPDNVVVFRNAEPEPLGFVIHLALHETDDEDRAVDPCVRSLTDYVARHAPARDGEDVTVWTFNIDRAAYQRLGTATWTLGSVAHSQRHFGLDRPAWEFFVYQDGDYWRAPLEFADLRRLPEADFEIGGTRYAVFGHDWRVRGFDDWLDLMAARFRGADPSLDRRADEPAVLVLDHATFAAAVRHALRHLHEPVRLGENPLLRSRLVRSAATSRPAQAALRHVIEQGVAALGSTAKRDKLRRAVDRTYVRPAETQERAAELLGLPFSTYRRHLVAGVDALVADLWAQELDPDQELSRNRSGA